MRRVEYARVVRKGAVARSVAWSALAAGGVRGQLMSLGTAWRTDVGARLDLRPLSLELRLGLGGARHINDRLTIRSWETAASLAGLHIFDLRGLSIGLGLEAGLAWIGQRFSDGHSLGRDSLAGFFAPIAQLEIPIVRRLYARADGAFMTYLLHEQAAAGDVTAALSFRVSAGLGVYF
jgi:hypothetical protein